MTDAAGDPDPPLARVLGPVRIPDRLGRLVEPPGALPRRLVVALALAGPEGRSIAGLTEDLWPDEAPRNPRGAVQMLVSRTRAVAADGLLASSPVGYRLTASDLALAEQVANTPGGDAGSALELWCGSPGADLDDPLLADDLAARAVRARYRLLLARAGALVTSDPVAALRDLDELAASRPLDAEAQRLRMLALAAAGRTGEAIASFADHRRRLADELGADPDPELVRLNAQLLRAGTSRAELVGVRVGPTRLLGRDEDLRRLIDLVSAHRLTSIVGVGGLGKTRLAHEVAGALAERFARIVFVELAGAREDEDIALVVGAAAGARVTQPRRRLNEPPADLGHRIRDALTARPTLLVLDNCEHVIGAVAVLTADLLATVPTLTVLTTTRIPLLLAGEQIHAPHALDSATDAVDLFRERAAAARPDVRLDTRTVHRICAHLDGLPLAIELAAARLRSMTLEELERRLDDRFAVLVGGERTAPARHRTLFAVIDWSWQLLSPDRRDALRMLSIFPDGFTADGASSLLGREASAVLTDLVDQSLLTFAESRGRGRYRMLATVREFGLRALAEAGESEAAARALDRVALEFVRRVAPRLTGGLDPSSSTETALEEETLLAVLRAAPAAREAVVLAVFALLAEFWIYRGEFDRIPEQLSAVLAAGRHRPLDELERDEALRALCLAGGFGALTRTPGGVRALALLDRVARTLPAEASGFWPGLAASLLVRRTGEDALAEVQRLAATSTDPMTMTFNALLTGQLLENAGRIADALTAVTRSRRLAERHGLTWFHLVATMNIAQLHSQQARRQEGLRGAREALEEARAVDLRADLALLDWVIAVNGVALGQVDDAEARFSRLAATGVTAGRDDATDNRSIGLAGLAEVATARGEIARALDAWREAAAVAERATTPWRLTVTAAALAGTVRLAGSDDRSAQAYRRLRGRTLALARFRQPLDVPVFASAVLGLAAALLAARGAEDAAEQQALGAALVRLAVPLGARVDLPALESVGGVAEALAVRIDPSDRDETVDRVIALLQRPAARI